MISKYYRTYFPKIKNTAPSFSGNASSTLPPAIIDFCRKNEGYNFYNKALVRKNRINETAYVLKKENPEINNFYLLMLNSRGDKIGSINCDLANNSMLRQIGFSDRVMEKENYKNGCIWGIFIHNKQKNSGDGNFTSSIAIKDIYKRVGSELLKAVVLISEEKGYEGRFALESSHAARFYETFGFKKDFDAGKNNLYYLPFSTSREILVYR